jgi:hypothetical protein
MAQRTAVLTQKQGWLDSHSCVHYLQLNTAFNTTRLE